ncbi:protein WEAK CHLOROPLAST MOVEMENT UNDER BLUE LIGHT 1-like [Musa acuminata AAA Group]|uniref:protein WEAK CHLOROPLAST MOVEMENT UNDER BLUE LIGHT 1-like n=1 Tax=Musa acuminata AAA Group TaxID=214697 RepID=UPI0031D39056
MGEIDTKPFESVKTALSFFEQKAGQNRCASSGNMEEQEEKDLCLLLKELANCKVQLEINKSANKQANLELEVYHKTVDDLSIQLENSVAEIDRYREKCQQAETKIAKLESENKVIAQSLLGSSEHESELLGIVDELKALQEEEHAMGSEVTASGRLHTMAERRAELMGQAIFLESDQRKKLLLHISALNEALFSSTLAAIEADKERYASFFRMEAELHITKEALAQSHDKLEGMKDHLDMMNNMENELFAKMIQVDYLQSELKQLEELYSACSRFALDVVTDANQLASEMETPERARSKYSSYLALMEAEKKRMHNELQSERDKVTDLNCQIELLSSRTQTLKHEMSEMRGREMDLEEEITTLKADLHRSRSRRILAAEARATVSQSGLYIAVQELALETKSSKMESQVQKKDAESEMEMDDKADYATETKRGKSDIIDGYGGMAILAKESNSLTQETGKAMGIADSPRSSGFERTSNADMLNEELEAATSRINDLRSNLEEATRRAELAEKAKAAIEDQLRKWRAEQTQRRAAADSLTKQRPKKDSNNGKRSTCTPSLPKSVLRHHADGSPPDFDGTHLNYVPLAKELSPGCCLKRKMMVQPEPAPH